MLTTQMLDLKYEVYGAIVDAISSVYLLQLEYAIILAQVASVKGSPVRSYLLTSWINNLKVFSCIGWSWASRCFNTNACFGVSLAALGCVVACLCAFGLACGVVVAFLCSSTALCAFACTLVVSGFVGGCALVSWCVMVGVSAGLGAVVLASFGLGMYAWAYVQAGGGVFAWLCGFVKVCMGPGVSVASFAYSCARASLSILLAWSWVVTSSLSCVSGYAGFCMRICIPARLYRSSV